MKDNKVYKFSEYLKENIQDTPESYVDGALTKIKSKIEKMFSYDAVEGGEVKRFGDISNQSKKEKGELSFKDLGLELQSLELSKYSKSYDNVKVKFSDPEFLYDLTIIVDLKDAVPTDDTKDFSDKDIEKCYLKFKKYDQDSFDLIGVLSKTVKISDIDEELLMNLKLELDEDYDTDEEEFEIETEEGTEEEPKKEEGE